MKLIDPIELTLDFAMLTSIEVPLAVAQSALPEQLDAIEIRPGISLAALMVFRITEGCEHAHFGALPAYSELILAFQVAPSLRRLLPRMAFYVARMTSSLEAANSFLDEVHWIDVAPHGLTTDVDRSGTSVTVSDEHGPILEMADRESSPAYAAKETLGQVFTRKDGRIAMYHELLSGPVREHQTRQAHVQLHDHPFLSPLGGMHGAPRTYLQMTGKPRATARQSAERPTWME